MRTKRTLALLATGFALAWFGDPVSGARRRRRAASVVRRRTRDESTSSSPGALADRVSAPPVDGPAERPVDVTISVSGVEVPAEPRSA